MLAGTWDAPGCRILKALLAKSRILGKPQNRIILRESPCFPDIWRPLMHDIEGSLGAKMLRAPMVARQ